MSTRSRSCPSVSWTLQRAATVLLVLACWGLAGCSSASIKTAPRTNIVMAGKQGEPIDPVTYQRLLETTEKDQSAAGGAQTYDRYIDDIFKGIVDFCAKQKEKKEKSCKVLMFFHGGLDQPEDTVKRAADLSCDIKEAGSYPIFVNWKASLSSTYWDHLAHIHKGFYYRHMTVPLVPYVFVTDEGKSVVDVLSTWGTEARHTFHHERLNQATKAYRNLLIKPDQDDKATVDLNCLLTDGKLKDQHCLPTGDTLIDERSPSSKFWHGTAGVLTFGSKLLTLPLVVAAGGPGAWSVLERRTETLFRTEGEFRGKSTSEVEREKEQRAAGSNDPTVEDDTAGAALAHFIDRFQGQNGLVQQLCESGTYDPEKAPVKLMEPKVDLPILKTDVKGEAKECKVPLEITLVGHSMGAIIIDRLLRYAPKLDVTNIVFMAAATTLEDYKDTIGPYLAAHRNTQMYHLVLHPEAEIGESHFLDLSPRGSLLVWLDNFFTDPADPLGRRVGRFSNLLPELTFTPKEIRGQIHVKVFRVGTQVSCWNPQNHGDFGNFPFWDKNFWCPSVDSVKGAPVRLGDKDGCPASQPVQEKEASCERSSLTSAPLTAPASPSTASRH